MTKIWLPPIETCCEECNFYFQLHDNLTLHLIIDCKQHGKHFIKNPLSTSKHEIGVIPSKHVKKALEKYHKDKSSKGIEQQVI